MRNRRKLVLGVVLTLALGCGGCASDGQKGSSGETRTERSAGDTALAYTRALYTGHFADAERLVIPDYRAVLAAMMVSVGKHSLSVEKLRAGSVKVHGKNAVVVIEGTLCTTATKYSIAQTRAAGMNVACASNANPRSGNVGFWVRVQQEATRWFVTFAQPSKPAGS